MGLYPDILRLRDLLPGTIFETIQQTPRRGVTTRWKDDFMIMCVEIDRYPGQMTPEQGAMPVKILETCPQPQED